MKEKKLKRKADVKKHNEFFVPERLDSKVYYWNLNCKKGNQGYGSCHGTGIIGKDSVTGKLFLCSCVKLLESK